MSEDTLPSYAREGFSARSPEESLRIRKEEEKDVCCSNQLIEEST